MIKFIVAGLWICAVTIGAVIYSFQVAGARSDGRARRGTARRPRLRQDRRAFGAGAQAWRRRRLFPDAAGLYGRPEGDKEAVGAGPDADQRSGLHLSLHQSATSTSPQTDTLDLDTFRNGLRDSINKRIGEDLIHDIMIEQIDFLSKQEIRDNALRRRTAPEEPKADKGKPEPRDRRGKARPLSQQPLSRACTSAAVDPRTSPRSYRRRRSRAHRTRTDS